MEEIASNSLSQPALILLLDHENLPFPKISIKEILCHWLDSLTSHIRSVGIVSIRIRAYGGWYDGTNVSDARYRASEFYQDCCPIGFRHHMAYCKVRFEFADSLVLPFNMGSSDTVPVTHTVATRNSPYMMGLRQDRQICNESDCQLQSIKKWLRAQRGCPRPGCPQAFVNQFIRREQKQVDIHIALDLITFAEQSDANLHIGLASDDYDMIPALAAAVFRRKSASSLTWLRFKNYSTYLDNWLRSRGVQLTTVPPPAPHT